MTELLLRLFVKNYHNSNDPAVHSAVGRLAGITGIVCNALLFAGKLIMGLLVGSISILADAVNNLSDAASSVVTLLGFRMARQPADEDHPYGHARYEYLSGLVVAVFILLIGVQLAASSVEKIIHPSATEFSIATFVVLILSMGVKLWMSVFFRSLGKRIRSTTLQATSVDSRNDVISSFAVLAGFSVEHFFHVNIDGYVGLAVALFILYSGIQIAREAISPLLGKQADKELVERISQLVLSHEKVLGIHDLLVHDYGPGQCFASVHVELSADEDLLSCHDIIDHIESDSLEQLNVHLVIHNDPVIVCDKEWNEMRQAINEIIHEIDPQLSMHDFRIVKDAEPAKLVFDLAVPYSMNQQHEELKAKIDEALHNKGKQYMTVIRFDGTA